VKLVGRILSDERVKGMSTVSTARCEKVVRVLKHSGELKS